MPMSLRTISVGDYESLFGQKSPEEIEVERQAEVASGYLNKVISISDNAIHSIVAASFKVNFMSEDLEEASALGHEFGNASRN